MGDKETFTEVTKTSWLNRLGQSVKGVGAGFLLFIYCGISGIVEK